MHFPTRVFLITGSNIEPRITFLQDAEKEIGQNIGTILRKSAIYESQPWGFRSETNFLNQVMEIETFRSAGEVLKLILNIELKLGRTREDARYLSRTIDIDILYFGHELIKEKDLQVPHPRLHLRKFTMMPLVEIAPDYEHPGLKKTNRELLNGLTDNSGVWKHKENVEI